MKRVLIFVVVVMLVGCQQQPKPAPRSPAVLMEDAGQRVSDARAKLAPAIPKIADPEAKTLVVGADMDLERAQTDIATAVTAEQKEEKAHDKQVAALEKKIDRLSDPAVKWLGLAGGALIVIGIGLCISTYWLGRTMLRIGLLAIAMGAVAATLARFLPVVEWIVLGVLIVAAAFALWRWRAVYAAGVKVVQSIDEARNEGLVMFHEPAGRLKKLLDQVQGPAGKELVDAAQGKRKPKRTISGSLRV